MKKLVKKLVKVIIGQEEYDNRCVVCGRSAAYRTLSEITWLDRWGNGEAQEKRAKAGSKICIGCKDPDDRVELTSEGRAQIAELKIKRLEDRVQKLEDAITHCSADYCHVRMYKNVL